MHAAPLLGPRDNRNDKNPKAPRPLTYNSQAQKAVLAILLIYYLWHPKKFSKKPYYVEPCLPCARVSDET